MYRQQTKPPGMLDVAAMSAAFGVTVQTIQRWGRSGVIPKPAMRMGRKLFWYPEAVEEAKAMFAAQVDFHHNLKPKEAA